MSECFDEDARLRPRKPKRFEVRRLAAVVRTSSQIPDLGKPHPGWTRDHPG